jgi:hypothetical protein
MLPISLSTSSHACQTAGTKSREDCKYMLSKEYMHDPNLVRN